jgi:hypothetical protein
MVSLCVYTTILIRHVQVVQRGRLGRIARLSRKSIPQVSGLKSGLTWMRRGESDNHNLTRALAKVAGLWGSIIWRLHEVAGPLRLFRTSTTSCQQSFSDANDAQHSTKHCELSQRIVIPANTLSPTFSSPRPLHVNNPPLSVPCSLTSPKKRIVDRHARSSLMRCRPRRFECFSALTYMPAT